MKQFLFFFISFFALNSIIAQTNTLSEYAEISLLSCERGLEAYNSYGHSALRVKDPITELDLVFNYGTFDYNTEYFVPKFVKGTLDYSLSVGAFKWFINTYKYENRTVVEQILNLNQAEKQAVFDRLIVNYETDEKYYRYDFFYDNCSSRIHEILKEVLGDELIYGPDLNENSPETYRDLIDPYTKHSPWLDFGIGIIMGYPTDNIATNKQKMFLPDFLMERFDIATYNGKPFVKSKQIIYQSEPNIVKTNIFTSPLFIFSLISLLIICLSIYNYYKGKHFYSIDYFLFFITGFVGIFFLFMWFGTRHSPTFMNMNMFWAMPLNIIALFFLKNPIIKPYLILMTLLNVFGFFILPQVFTIAILPLALLLATRYFKNYLGLAVFLTNKT